MRAGARASVTQHARDAIFNFAPKHWQDASGTRASVLFSWFVRDSNYEAFNSRGLGNFNGHEGYSLNTACSERRWVR